MLSQQSFIWNQISSYDDFISSQHGIKSILQNMFRINNCVMIEPTVVEVNGVKKTIRSIEIDIRFTNVEVQPIQVADEQVEAFLSKDNKDEKLKYVVTDTQLPQEARLTGKTLKVNVFADIVINFTSFSDLNL